jgi:hypothetical protein
MNTENINPQILLRSNYKYMKVIRKVLFVLASTLIFIFAIAATPFFISFLPFVWVLGFLIEAIIWIKTGNFDKDRKIKLVTKVFSLIALDIWYMYTFDKHIIKELNGCSSPNMLNPTTNPALFNTIF